MLMLKHVHTPLGVLVLGESDEALCMCDWADSRLHDHTMSRVMRRFGDPTMRSRTPLLERVERWIRGYFAGEVTPFSLPLITVGTEWQQAVLREVMKIPYGTTETYGAIASGLDMAGAARAVGAAVAANPLSLVIPCHRVVPARGGTGQYNGGASLKMRLIALEQGCRRHG